MTFSFIHIKLRLDTLFFSSLCFSYKINMLLQVPTSLDFVPPPLSVLIMSANFRHSQRTLQHLNTTVTGT